MDIQRKHLAKAVRIYGIDPFGRKAWIQFEPMLTTKKGWYIGSTRNPDLPPVPVNAENMRYSKRYRNMSLRAFGERFNIVEHWIAMRWSGLDGVLVTASGPWPPYLLTSEMLRHLRPQMIEGEGMIEFFHIPVAAEGLYRYRRNGSFTVVNSNLSSETTINASVSYFGVGGHRETVEVTDELLDEVFPVGTQGYPKFRYGIVRFLALFAWSFRIKRFLVLQRTTVVWPWMPGVDPEEVPLQFWRHRITDILGALALVDNERLPYCELRSVFSGHKNDLAVMQDLAQALKQAEPANVPSSSIVA